MLRLTKTRVGVLFLLLCVGLADGYNGQPGPFASAAQAPSGAIVIAQAADIIEVIPHRTLWSTDSSVHFAIYDSLVQRDDDMKFIPVLAKAWRTVTPTEWVFELREGVKFHNGEDLTAETVKWNVDYAIRPGQKRDPQFSNWEGAQVMGRNTVKIITKKPDPLMVARLPRFFILPQKYTEQVGEDEFMRKPIGTGAYRWVERVKDSHITLEANRDYFGGPPTIRRVTFKIIPDAATRFSALKAREVHIVAGVTPDQAQLLEADASGPAVAAGVASARGALITFFPDSPQGGGQPLKDKRVRHALNMGVDVEKIIKFVLNGNAYRTPTLFPEVGFAYDKTLRPYPYDPERAKALLAEAGYANGFDITLEVSPIFVVPKTLDVAQTVAADLKRIGVNVNIRTVEFGTIIKLRDERKIAPMFLWSWGFDLLDPDRYYFAYAYSKSPWSFWSDPKIDALIERGATTMNARGREQIYKELHALVKDESPALFLYTSRDLYGVSKRLVWRPRSDERIMVRNLRWAR